MQQNSFSQLLEPKDSYRWKRGSQSEVQAMQRDGNVQSTALCVDSTTAPEDSTRLPYQDATGSMHR